MSEQEIAEKQRTLTRVTQEAQRAILNHDYPVLFATPECTYAKGFDVDVMSLLMTVIMQIPPKDRITLITGILVASKQKG